MTWPARPAITPWPAKTPFRHTEEPMNAPSNPRADYDAVARRIQVEPTTSAYVEPDTIDWPDGFAPVVGPIVDEYQGELPACDVAIMTYTYAEGMALADVLSPGIERSKWAKYTHDWSSYEPHLTQRSPAKDAHCAAYVQRITLDGKQVLLIKSNLHLSTDDETIPIKTLIERVAEDTQCDWLITTGTAGGVGDEVLGDVIVAQNVKLNLAGSEWEHESYAQQSFAPSAYTGDTSHVTSAFQTLIPDTLADHLTPSDYASRSPELITGKDIETVPYFAFADVTDHYGIVANDPNVGCEEMDDGVVALTLNGSSTKWMAVRNASDPQMPDGSPASKKLANDIYERYGYWTSVASVLTVWGFVVGL